MARTASQKVATSAGCAPLREMFAACRSAGWSRWPEAEGAFLEAMWRFDQNLAAGIAGQGDNQNGKGDFFTDVLCVLLEHCSGKQLEYRPAVAGRIFRGHARGIHDVRRPDESRIDYVLSRICDQLRSLP